jgi:prepilin-type N-terminal cleavage/methylation domain-containing protein
MRRTAHSSGFTLIEALVVISVIGILSAAVVTSLSSARVRGRDAQRVTDIKRIQVALQQYYDANDRYPSSISTVLVSGGFLDRLPSDPSDGRAYSYAAYVNSLNGNTTLCSSYHLGADLESSTNAALQADQDAYVGGVASAGETIAPELAICSGSAADFHGTDTNGSKCNASDFGVSCYDVRP